jgi:hypothetical protein
MAATRISASEMRFPCDLRCAYISAALTMASSLMGRTMLYLQNVLKASICFSAPLAFNPFKISYHVMCEMVSCLCSFRYPLTFPLTKL